MFIAPPPDDPATERLYQACAGLNGFIMNLTRAWAWRPEVYEAFTALRGQLTVSATLTRRELAVMVCAGAAELKDAYCSLSWGRTLAAEATPQAAAQVIRGECDDGLPPREAALADWARRVVADPNGTTADDVARLRAAGLSDREIAEATMFIALRLAFSTVNDALGVQPDRRLRDAAPPEVAAAVCFGRPVAA